MNLKQLLFIVLLFWKAQAALCQCDCCPVPAFQPTQLSFAEVSPATISGSFTGSTGANAYLVVRSTGSQLSTAPVQLHNYNEGDILGNGTIVSISSATGFTATGLSQGTLYYFFIYAYKNCAGGKRYRTSNPLTGSATTTSTCIVPASQPLNAVFSNISSAAITLSFTATAADEYLVVMSLNSSLSALPVNGTSYTVNNNFGGGIIIGRGPAITVSGSGLTGNTLYYFYVFAFNNCSGGPVYKTNAPLTASQSTLFSVCGTPSSPPTGLVFSSITYNSIDGTFTADPGTTGYLVLISPSASLTVLPVNTVQYSNGTILGNATVISSGSTNTFSASGLNANTTYYFYIFSYNDGSCAGGPKYLSATPLTGSNETISPPASALNFYFGNLHSHSSYSDGNADDVTKTPADDYNFAKTALCLDFLGICEHNHAESGMSLSNWQPGIVQANAATVPGFVALHGMEWGTISTGGHVVIYGIDSLIGWEPNNYQIFVAKGDYRGANGLFSILNRNGNAFAYFAHPDNGDYNGVLSGTFDNVVASVVVGSAVENGPAFSTSTTYNDFPSSMSYLSYYRGMLAKGYKLGPSMDHDNHNMTFGKTVTSRLVILATQLDKASLLTSMKQRRFYATQDCSARITYSINTQSMGSIISHTGPPVISVSCVTSAGISSLKVMYGVPGSGSSATQLTSTSGSTLNYTDNALTVSGTRYYYLDITESDGKRIITAPIWYTRE